jgi:uncharacterized protein YegL
MTKRRPIELFSISFLDMLSGALGAVIILYVAIPKTAPVKGAKEDIVKEILKEELAISKVTIEELKKELQVEKQKNKFWREQKNKTVSSEIDADIGFKFKGKNIVFIIDTSYSMIEEDRITQVKAGIKMLLTSLPKNYKVDIVQFPLKERAPFRSMWGAIKDFEGINRMDAFDFIYSLTPSGGTPTRDTLLFVLKNYEDISDVVLLTDGAPTFHNSNQRDDIYEILRLVRENNQKKIQISAIGVGSTFLRDKTSEQYKFLSLLSSEHNGFFVSF